MILWWMFHIIVLFCFARFKLSPRDCISWESIHFNWKLNVLHYFMNHLFRIFSKEIFYFQSSELVHVPVTETMIFDRLQPVPKRILYINDLQFLATKAEHASILCAARVIFVLSMLHIKCILNINHIILSFEIFSSFASLMLYYVTWYKICHFKMTCKTLVFIPPNIIKMSL